MLLFLFGTSLYSFSKCYTQHKEFYLFIVNEIGFRTCWYCCSLTRWSYLEDRKQLIRFRFLCCAVEMEPVGSLHFFI